jgi:hypothetical protein
MSRKIRSGTCSGDDVVHDCSRASASLALVKAETAKSKLFVIILVLIMLAIASSSINMMHFTGFFFSIVCRDIISHLNLCL